MRVCVYMRDGGYDVVMTVVLCIRTCVHYCVCVRTYVSVPVANTLTHF